MHRLGHFGECLNCVGLDFHDIFGFGSFYELDPVLFRDAYINAEDCAFCRLLVRATSQFTPAHVVHHRNGALVTLFISVIHFEITPTELGSRFLEVTVSPPPSPLDERRKLAFHLIPISESLPQSPCHIVDQNQIDLGTCRKWIVNCEREHGNRCSPLFSTLSASETALLLIDVVDECVVEPPPHAQYVALSYVWGQFQCLQLNTCNVQILSQKGSLFNQQASVGQTIIDAMTVVKALGGRYLWADQLCIIQDNSDKFEQVKSMDRVYGAAWLTIVAADGEDANVGLPGVRPGTRTRNISQLFEEVWPGLHIAVTMDSPLDPAGSIWGSRGWTCQEQLLSRRMLLFHQGGVIWQCHTAFSCEDAPVGMKVDPEKMRRVEQLPSCSAQDEASPPRVADQEDYTSVPLFRPTVFVQYSKAVREYTTRRLTFPDDIVDAFQGILSQLSRQIGTNILAALPESYLDVALLWTPLVLQTRRESRRAQIPSWSWVGWVGQADCAEASPDGREWIELTTKWYIKDGPIPPRLVNEVGIGIDEIPLGGSLSFNTMSWMPIFESVGDVCGEQPVVELPNSNGLYLQFWTSCTYFTIIRRRWRTPDEVQANASARRPIQAPIHCATGSRRQLAGYLVLNGDGPEIVIEGRHEFIVLSGAQVKGFDPISGNLVYSDEAQMYNVMLVEWNDTRQIASRLGIGKFFKEAWDMSLPVIRFVTLG